MKVTLVKDTLQISKDEMTVLTQAVQYFAGLVTKAWDKETVEVSDGLFPVDKTWNIHLSDDKLNTNAFGYHTVENGLPVAYVSPFMCRVSIKFAASHNTNLWGKAYKYPAKTLMSKGLTIAGKVIIKPHVIYTRPARPSIFIPGMVSVICHELAEMIADPLIDNWATIPVGTDNFLDGGSVLVEVGDHTPAHFDAQILNQDVVLPDFTFPSFYDGKGKAPYSYVAGTITAPFQFVHRAYAYIKDSTGARMKNFAAVGDDRV
jgi:hypothetical protein